MYKYRMTHALGVMILLAGQSPAQQEETTKAHGTSKFVVHVDIAAFRKTDFGAKLFEIAKSKGVEELESDASGLERVKEQIGFDPFDEVQSVTIVGSEFQCPEDSLRLMLGLKKTIGNLEGLMPGLPGYDASTYRQYQIHSASSDSKTRFFGAIHTDRSGNKSILVAKKRDEVVGMLDTFDGRSSDLRYTVKPRLGHNSDAFVYIKLLELPLDQIGGGSHANVAKLLQEVTLTLSGDGGQLQLDVIIQTKEEQQAKKISQVVQGLVALVSLAQSQDDADEDLKRAQSMLQELRVDVEETRVRLQLMVSEEQVLELLTREMD